MKKVFISMVCVLIALSGCTHGGSNKEATADSCANGKESMEVVLNIKRKVKPECVSALKESFLKCKESTLLEPGCIDYGMYQSLTDSTEFFIAETWKNDRELQKHLPRSMDMKLRFATSNRNGQTAEKLKSKRAMPDW